MLLLGMLLFGVALVLCIFPFVFRYRYHKTLLELPPLEEYHGDFSKFSKSELTSASNVLKNAKYILQDDSCWIQKSSDGVALFEIVIQQFRLGYDVDLALRILLVSLDEHLSLHSGCDSSDFLQWEASCSHSELVDVLDAAIVKAS